jgi:MFS family permease
MTSQTPSPLLVALLQTAESLPIFLLALPAGALADIVDRRRLLLFTQIWLCIAATALGVLTVLELTTPTVLLVFAFLVGIATALNVPAWQAITQELVPREQLSAAATLGAVGFNIARAVGPAVGGLLVAAIGPGPVFLLNAASFLAVITALYRWNRQAPLAVAPAERMLTAMRAGMRYARHAPIFQAVVIRTTAFIFSLQGIFRQVRHRFGAFDTLVIRSRHFTVMSLSAFGFSSTKISLYSEAPPP